MEAATTAQTGSLEERVRETFDMLNSRDLARADEVWGPDTIEDFVAIGEFRGTQEIRAFFEGMLAAIPDFSLQIERVLVDGSVTTVPWRMTGTFGGAPFLGLHPTGRSLELRGVDVIDWAPDGRMARNTIYYDGQEFARQVGMLPPRDSAPDRAITGAFNAVTKLRAAVKERLA